MKQTKEKTLEKARDKAIAQAWKDCEEARAQARKAYKDATDPGYKAYNEENINEAT